MPSNRSLTALSIVACLAVVGAGTTLTARSVPKRLEAAAKTRLADAGVHGATVGVRARDLTIVAPADDGPTAIAATSEIRGVRSVAFLPAAEPPNHLDVTIAIGRRCINVFGLVPDRQWLDGLSRSASNGFGQCTRTTLEARTQDPKLARLISPTQNLIETLARDAAEATALLDDDEISLDAEVFTEAGIERIIEALDAFGQLADKPNLRLSSNKLQDRLAEMLGRAGINFEPNSAAIDQPSQLVLDTAVEALTAAPAATIEIGGHADNRGDPEANLDLSQRRADSVRAYLATHGVAGERLTAVGYGASRPVADNESEAGMFANRRIEFVVLSQGA